MALPAVNVDQSLAIVVSEFLTTEDLGDGSSSSGPVARVDEGNSQSVMNRLDISNNDNHTVDMLPITQSRCFTINLSSDVPVSIHCDILEMVPPTVAVTIHVHHHVVTEPT
uniref:Uncharacterized protein n=1 Tax=Cannabis sativa TaxID=3483 RepID=A0A803Q7S0_CANSA